MSIQQNIRETMLGIVTTLADPDELRGYERQGVNVLAELYCQWFDDLYHPDDPLFQSAFSHDALGTLSTLNSALVACDPMIEGSDVATALKSDWWKPVERAARDALALLRADA